jgi:hypothetical protein
VTLLVILATWFATGVLATLLLGPRLRRAAEAAGVPVEPEPVYLADRSPLRWRLGTLAVVGLLAGSTGMAAAGALPGSAQSIAHQVLGTVGVHVPQAPDAPTEVAATGPAPTPWSDLGPSTSSPGPGEAPSSTDPSVAAPPAGGSDGAATAGTGSASGGTSDAATTAGSGTSTAPTTVAPSSRPEGSDVSDDPAVDEPTTTVPPGQQSADPPADPGDDPGTTTTSTTSTTSTSTTLPAPPPPEPPAG